MACGIIIIWIWAFLFRYAVKPVITSCPYTQTYSGLILDSPKINDLLYKKSLYMTPPPTPRCMMKTEYVQ